MDNIDAMNSAIKTSLYHVCDYHDGCPKSDDTWCLYNPDSPPMIVGGFKTQEINFWGIVEFQAS